MLKVSWVLILISVIWAFVIEQRASIYKNVIENYDEYIEKTFVVNTVFETGYKQGDTHPDSIYLSGQIPQSDNIETLVVYEHYYIGEAKEHYPTKKVIPAVTLALIALLVQFLPCTKPKYDAFFFLTRAI